MSGSYDELRMHDQIQAMGRGIVYEESPMEPGKRSRLWSYDEILEVLEDRKGTQMIEGILPHLLCRFSSLWLHREDFAMMPKLRFLYIDGANSEVEILHLPSNLRWFSWRSCPLKILPTDFYHKKLVHMDLSRSHIIQAWTNKPQNGSQRFQKLKVLRLQYCYHLSESPDFSWFPNLEILDLGGCENMVNLHKSIGDLKALVELSLIRTKIKELPDNICRLSSLKDLILSSCTSLKSLPVSIGDLKSLDTLSLDGTEIEKLPSSTCSLSSLQRLDLDRCKSLNKLPEFIGDLNSLVKLSMCGTKIEELPHSTCKLSSLKRLVLDGCRSLNKLPESICYLNSLVELSMYGTKIEKLGEISVSTCRLSFLQRLDLGECKLLNKLPESIGDLNSLVELSLCGTKIEELPSSICRLGSLQRLDLNRCESLNKLPESIGELNSLVELSIRGTKIEELPSSACRLSSLQRLDLGGCESLNKLPKSIGDLNSLVELSMRGTKIEELPSSCCRLSSLQRLDLDRCELLNKLPESIGDLKSLVELSLYNTQIKELPNGVGLLEKLEVLSAMDCKYLVKLPMHMGRMRCLRSINLIGTSILFSPDDSLMLPSLVELKIGSTLVSSLPTWISGLLQLQKLLLQGCTKLESLPELPSNLSFLKVVDCISLQKLPDLSSLKKLRTLSLRNCKKLEEIRGLEGTESLEQFYICDCNSITDTSRKIHGQGTLLVDGLSRSDSLNVNDGIYKGLTLCIVFALSFTKEKVQVNVQQGELVDIWLHAKASIRRKDRWTICVVDMLIEGIEFTTERDIVYIHHFKGFDWFGFPLEGKDAIERIRVMDPGISCKHYEYRYLIRGEMKFWKLLLGSSESEQPIPPDQESSAKMVADFFCWSCDDAGRSCFILEERE
ncbi:disease resistance protein RPV1-like isoform X1 [Macadamia integrifolia]|uniref:disease resistance protein RPV1-like isoform X1 n=2 Tax=Macadamia integrifolia TaxID=60698 RepID=UPI001C4EA345|nr:disease resistance protein RPV1-like isoform X1 [Macadamia integrifolia]XP_042502263.1 disease resistance protein RPV1-like isoform X1 [Macadamia integrifolia]XP_042502264.1 disease resistance protein RPV1-like isoform X1 [Macadamia integrifolia]